MIHNDDRMRNRFSFNLPQSMTRTVKFLTISLPNKVISQLSRRIAIGTSSFPGLGPDILDRNRVRKDIQSGKLRSFAPMKVFKNALSKFVCVSFGLFLGWEEGMGEGVLEFVFYWNGWGFSPSASRVTRSYHILCFPWCALTSQWLTELWFKKKKIIYIYIYIYIYILKDA